MLAHAEDLRTTSGDDALAKDAQENFRASGLDPAHKALCEWAEKLTLTPAKCNREDADGLKAQGWSEEQIASAAQVVGFFNHLNRLADGLGIDLEPEMQ
jgi:uncharacterized peroxidase-related enzyme